MESAEGVICQDVEKRLTAAHRTIRNREKRLALSVLIA